MMMDDIKRYGRLKSKALLEADVNLAWMKESVRGEFIDFVAKYSPIDDVLGWYVGSTDDPEHALFHNHGVSRAMGIWHIKQVPALQIAKELEVELLDLLDAKGGEGGGSDKTVYIYAYKITASTIE
ncbi:MAG: hypothetical protein HC859_15545 [Bacteroidia bacterium]|nr:hypothetical protein [Bacteroidia bacterium]